MNRNIPEIYNLIQELSWHFGNHGFNGECCGDLSLVEFMALKKVNGSDSISVQDIGNALNFTKSGSSKIIDRLENKGYVKRETSTVDGRVCCVVATSKGVETIKNIIEQYSAYIDEMLNDYDSETIDNIKSVLKLLTASALKSQNSLHRKDGKIE